MRLSLKMKTTSVLISALTRCPTQKTHITWPFTYTWHVRASNRKEIVCLVTENNTNQEQQWWKVGAGMSLVFNYNKALLKGLFAKKRRKFTHDLFTTMLIEGWGKCLSPQNTPGVSEVNFLAAESKTIWNNWWLNHVVRTHIHCELPITRQEVI